MTSGITSIVDQITGRARIPEGAKPITSSREPRMHVTRSVQARPRTIDKLVAALDDEWRAVRTIAIRAHASHQSAYHLLPKMAQDGIAERKQLYSRQYGERFVYRRAR